MRHFHRVSPGPLSHSPFNDHPSGRFLYSANSGNDSFSVFSIDRQSGGLTQIGTAASLSMGVLPRNAQVHPNGKWIYFMSEMKGIIETHNVDPSSGALSFANAISQGNAPGAMAIDMSGQYAYVVSEGNGTTQAYSVSISDGSLTAVGSAISSGTEPRSLVIDPRSDFLYVADFAGGFSSTISIFTINSITGALTAAGTQGVAGSGTSSIQLVTEIQ